MNGPSRSPDQAIAFAVRGAASPWSAVKLPPPENHAIFLPGGALTRAVNGPRARLDVRPGRNPGAAPPGT